jgi:hypothetical protein
MLKSSNYFSFLLSLVFHPNHWNSCKGGLDPQWEQETGLRKTRAMRYAWLFEPNMRKISQIEKILIRQLRFPFFSDPVNVIIIASRII